MGAVLEAVLVGGGAVDGAEVCACDFGVAGVVVAFEGGVAEDANDLLHKLLTMGDDRNIKAVFVGGKKLA